MDAANFYGRSEMCMERQHLTTAMLAEGSLSLRQDKRPLMTDPRSERPAIVVTDDNRHRVDDTIRADRRNCC